MTPIELMADVLDRNLTMLKMTLSDFSDADLLVRPAPGANHTAWQLGHLACAEANMLNAVKPGTAPAPPTEFAAKFTKQTTGVDDPAAFPTKDDLLAALEKSREAAVAWVRSLTPEQLDQPTPERLQGFAPTLGHLAAMFPQHAMMHVGQFQVIRRKLGKPILF